MGKKASASSLLLFLAVVYVYAANGRTIGAGDTLPARYLPWSLLQHRSFHLDAFPVLYDEDARRTFPLLDGIPYFLRYRDGHYLSAYSPGPALVALPVYALPVLAGASPASWAPRLEKLAAALITATSVVILFRALRDLVSERWSLGIALIYAFGTSSLSVSSQALWQHGPSQLFLALVISCLVKGLREEPYLAYAGFPMAAAVTMRSTDLLIVLPVAAWILYTHRHLILRFVLFALPPAAGLALYYVGYFGPAGGGTGETTVPTWALFAQTPLSEGLPGLLWSPSRGVFVYSPVFLFSLLGCIAVWRRGPWAFRALSLGLPLVILVVSKWFLWWGGYTWGPRLLADTAPIFCFFLYPIVDYLDRRSLMRGLFIFLAALSVTTHAMGSYLYDWRWDGIVQREGGYAGLWSWRGSPLAFYGRQVVSDVRRLLPPSVIGGPTSANSPDLLAASYAADPIPPGAFSGEQIVIWLTAANTGRVVWLATAPDELGAVRLGWRWLRGDREETGGRDYLLSDIGPGAVARFRVRIPAPAIPGDHTLVIDMVSERVTWFADRGSRPVRAIVRVLPLEAPRLLSAPTKSDGPAPVAAIAIDRTTYRQGERQELAVTLRNPHRPRTFDAYIVLEGPQAAAFVYDGQMLSPATEASWRPWVKELPMPAEAVGRFTLALSGLSPGPYTWHLVLTEPGTYRGVVRAATKFTLEP